MPDPWPRGLPPGDNLGELEIGKLREGESRETARLLGAEVGFLGRTDGEAFADHEICEEVASILRAEQPIAEEGMSQTSQFEPDICVDISSVLEARNGLIRCHVCQNKDDRMVRHTTRMNQLRGAKAGVTAAEVCKSPLTRLAGRTSFFDRLSCFAPATLQG